MYAVKAGPRVFPTGHEAFDWTIDASVSGPAGFPAYGARHPSRREEGGADQIVCDGGRAPCHAAGTAMDRLPRAQYFAADVAAFSGLATAWSSRHGTQTTPVSLRRDAISDAGAGLRRDLRLLDSDSDAVTGGNERRWRAPGYALAIVGVAT
jgi:hypothetical protein